MRIGVIGFEPTASCSQSRRSSQAELHPGAASVVTGDSLFDVVLQKARYPHRRSILHDVNYNYNNYEHFLASETPTPSDKWKGRDGVCRSSVIVGVYPHVFGAQIAAVAKVA